MLNYKQILWQTCVVCLTAAAPVCGQTTVEDEPAHRYYQIRADVCSMNPQTGIDTFRSHASGAVSGPTTLDHEIVYGGRRFEVRMTPRVESKQLLATVVVEPAESDRLTRPLKEELDLSELQSTSVELARDADGRVYRLNISPSVVEVPKPRSFRSADLRLENWTLPNCPVIVNDQDYVGQLSMGTSPLLWCDILGVGMVECSLLHLKDAEALGTLDNGVITIRHKDGTSISISGVKNGIPRETLEGGPYTVWVRWKEPTMTAAEYHQGLERTIDELDKRIKNGDTTIDAESLRLLKGKLTSDRPTMMTGGLRGVRTDELEASDR